MGNTGLNSARSCLIRLATHQDQNCDTDPASAFPPVGQQLTVAGLIFEMDNVFYDATMWRRWLVRVLVHLGLSVDYRTFYEAWDRQYLPDVYCGRREFEEAFQAFLRASGLSWGTIDELEGASRIWRVAMEAEVRPLPQVIGTLARLTAAGIPLAVLANSAHPSACLREKLQRLGLAQYFSDVVSSIDLEAAKPSAICYRTALQSLGCGAPEIAYVGYDAAALAGARALGMQTVAFNPQAEAEGNVQLPRFEQLADLVVFSSHAARRKAS